MDRGTLTALIAVAAVAILGLLLRRMAVRGTPPAPADDAEGADAYERRADPDGDEPAGDRSTARAPVSSEGVAFVARAHGVLLLPLVESGDAPDWLERAVDSNYVPLMVLNQLYFAGAGGGIQPARSGTPLGAADLTGARVVRGGGGVDAWRLETLGRDGDFGAFAFSTREAAEAALEMLVVHEVVRETVDGEGNPVPATAEDFEEARRRYEETARDLASSGDEPPREGPWVSDRR